MLPQKSIFWLSRSCAARQCLIRSLEAQVSLFVCVCLGLIVRSGFLAKSQWTDALEVWYEYSRLALADETYPHTVLLLPWGLSFSPRIIGRRDRAPALEDSNHQKDLLSRGLCILLTWSMPASSLVLPCAGAKFRPLKPRLCTTYVLFGRKGHPLRSIKACTQAR